jgi:cysteine-rich repeat protein
VLDPEKTGEECRPAFLPCDAAEFCDGANGACPVDVDKPDGTACDDLDSRTVHDVCMAGLCAGDSHPCGNGALDGGEACDDGGSESGDCCSPTCEFEAAGSPCPDDDMCNGDETCDGAGTCEAGTPPDCDDESVCTADFCDPATGCVFDPDPAVDCADEWERASLLINESRQGREKLMLKLSYGPALTRADFGDPVSGATAYTVCFYREDTGAFAGDVTVDRTGSRCERRDCWKQVGRWSYRYSDGAYATDGVGTIKLIGGKAGRSRIEVHGRNQSRRAQLSLPAITEGLEHSFGGTRVQIRPSDAPTCFEANLGRVMRTGPTYFKAEN